MKILVTGAAGFIGFSFANDLLQKNKNVEIIGIDNFDDYYSIKLKKLRIKKLEEFKKFKFFKIDITNRNKIINFLSKRRFKYIVHLAAQAGVRFSQKQPQKYLNTNIFGFINLIDACANNPPKLFMYASSSSVYGDAKILPVKEKNKLNPKNVYATSKKLNEIIANFYSNYYKLHCVGLRFFTVYGEWGRPDMFLFKLFKAFHHKSFFYLNNSGNHKRDFTYIKDAVELMKRVIFKKRKSLNHEIYNICSNRPIKITKIINFFEKKFGKLNIKKISKNKLDVKNTHGSNSSIKKRTLFRSLTKYTTGVINSYNWYKKYEIYKL